MSAPGADAEQFKHMPYSIDWPIANWGSHALETRSTCPDWRHCSAATTRAGKMAQARPENGAQEYFEVKHIRWNEDRSSCPSRHTETIMPSRLSLQFESSAESKGKTPPLRERTFAHKNVHASRGQGSGVDRDSDCQAWSRLKARQSTDILWAACSA